MAMITHDCPHCGARNNSFDLVKSFKNPIVSYRWNAFFVCTSCWNGIVATVDDRGTGADPALHPGNLLIPNSATPYNFVVLDIFPKSTPSDIPEHLPDNVSKAFEEGCNVMKQSPSAACAMFRKSLELGLKALSPDIEAWKLEKRIDKLAAESKLTPALQEWTHRLRLDGNAAIHGDEDPTLEHARELESLTRFVLTYIYTLPKSVELAQHRDAE